MTVAETFATVAGKYIRSMRRSWVVVTVFLGFSAGAAGLGVGEGVAGR